MKTKFIFPILTLIILMASCTPAPISEHQNLKNPPIYGTGGEHSREPDNEKD